MAPGFRGQSTRKPAGPTVEGEAPPGADEASLFRGWPPVFGGKAHGNRLGRRWKAKRRRGHPVNEKAAIADGHGPFCGGCFFCGAAWALSLRENGFSPGFVRFLPKFKKVLASYTGVRCMILSRKKRPDADGMLAGAAPMTFHVEKRTFRADGHARRGKYATLDPSTCKSCPGAPPGP